MNAFPARRALLALGLAAMHCVLAAPAVAASDPPAAAVKPEARLRLPAKPSQMLRAPLATWEPVLREVACAVKVSMPSTVGPRYQPSGPPATAARNPGEATSDGERGGWRAMKCPVASTSPITQSLVRFCARIICSNMRGETTAVST